MANSGPARVILWGTPRCLSTAFLKAMTNVEDSIVWHEPYLYARRLGTDGPDKEKFENVIEAGMKAHGAGANFDSFVAMAKMLPFGYVGSEVSYQWVKEQLEADALGKKLIFNKDMVEGICDNYDAIPDGFRHAILLRHPLKVFPSFKTMASAAVPGQQLDIRTLPSTGMMPEGFFYKELCDLYQYLKDNKKDAKPIIICTDDLQKNPEVIMKAYCKEMGIEFTESILKWADDGDSIMQKWMISKENAMMLSGIHKNAFESVGFGELTELPGRDGMDEDILEVVDKTLPYYEKLHKNRLRGE